MSDDTTDPALERPAIFVPLLLGLALLVIVVVASVTGLAGQLRTLQCDGELPTWMLEAQGYDGGGCAEILPTHAAPPNADWTPYCLGLCSSTLTRPEDFAEPTLP